MGHDCTHRNPSHLLHESRIPSCILPPVQFASRPLCRRANQAPPWLTTSPVWSSPLSGFRTTKRYRHPRDRRRSSPFSPLAHRHSGIYLGSISSIWSPDQSSPVFTSATMAARRLSSLVHGGQASEAFDSSLGNEAQLARLGYEQGQFLSSSLSIPFHSIPIPTPIAPLSSLS